MIVILRDLMLIDNNLFKNFWGKTIEIANYLPKTLFTKSKNYSKIILEEN